MIFAVSRAGEIWTDSWPWSEVRDAQVPLKCVARPTARYHALVFHVKADSRSKRPRDLTGWVAGDHVAADEVIGNQGLEQNPVRISPDAVLLEHIAAAA